ncbi:unnamed protein product, partial [Symbiodinium sp. CCMP2456]
TDVITRLTDEKALIEEQLQQEKLQREELCRQLQALEAKQRAADRAFEEKKEIEEKLRIEKQKEHELQHTAEKERLRKEQADLQKETLLAKESAADLQKRLSVLEQQEQQQRAEARKEQELRCRLEEERKLQQDREADLVSQLDALKGIQESFALDEEQLAAKREEQHRQREAELAKLGMHCAGMDLDDVPKAPKLVNLHPDPALKAWPGWPIAIPLVVHDAFFDNLILLIMAKMLTALLAFLMAGAQARLGETSERPRNTSRPSPEDLLPGGAARREEYWSNSTLRFNVNPSLSKLHDVTRRLGYDHLATTTRYGDTCCASCGSIDTAKLVAGTGFYAVASAEAMQAHGIGDGHYCTKDASGSSGMGCLSCARGKFLWYHPFDYPLWAQKGSSIFRKELKIVVADTCPHKGNEAWCPGRQGSSNQFGVRHHFDFASPPGKYDNYYFAWKKMECPDYIKRRYASLSRC